MMNDRQLLNRLITMHAYARPAGSAADRLFAVRYLQPLGATQDDHGNFHLMIGDSHRIVWASHTDTVHKQSGSQRVCLGADRMLRSRSGDCLGADDTTGVFIMTAMADRRVPGHYIWHFGEEHGCIGSRALVASKPEWLSEVEAVVSLDRAGTTEVITHQIGARTASDAFAGAVADDLNRFGLTYTPSDRGMYTDSEAYAEAVPECTNLAVGYQGQHSASEYVDTDHVFQLLEALTRAKPADWPITRDPEEYTGWIDFDRWSQPIASRRSVSGVATDAACFAGVDYVEVDGIWRKWESLTADEQDRYATDLDDDDDDDDETVYLDRAFALAQRELKAQLRRAPRPNPYGWRK